MFKISKYIMLDMMRSRVLMAYALLLAGICVTIFLADADADKGLVSIATVVLTIVPLVSIVYATTYYFNALEFTELLVAQPVSRTAILLGQFTGISLSVLGAFLAGAGIPVLLFAASATGFTLLAAGSLATLGFVALAFLASALTRDKAQGIGLALMTWFYFSVIFDALVLLFLFTMNEYPLEKAMIVLSALNPIDLARIMILLQLDISALMGYTGALYQQFFGSGSGMLFALAMLTLWAGVPLALALRVFRRKDL
ncbi:MAG TPA: ABC transporter permease subunit [Sphingobacteriaceae bacterium]